MAQALMDDCNDDSINQAATGKVDPPPSMSLDGLYVMCVDNEPSIVEGLELLLSGWQCRVATAGSASEIEELIARDSMPPDAIIADYHLDDGTGIDVISSIRRHWNGHIPAVLVTADRTLDVRNHAEEQSIAMFNKPLRPAALRAFLNQIAAARKSAAE